MWTGFGLFCFIVAFFFDKKFRNTIITIVVSFWLFGEIVIGGNWEYLLIFVPFVLLLIYQLVQLNKEDQKEKEKAKAEKKKEMEMERKRYLNRYRE